jgi:hypothetical protein
MIGMNSNAIPSNDEIEELRTLKQLSNQGIILGLPDKIKNYADSLLAPTQVANNGTQSEDSNNNSTPVVSSQTVGISVPTNSSSNATGQKQGFHFSEVARPTFGTSVPTINTGKSNMSLSERAKGALNAFTGFFDKKNNPEVTENNDEGEFSIYHNAKQGNLDTNKSVKVNQVNVNTDDDPNIDDDHLGGGKKSRRRRGGMERKRAGAGRRYNGRALKPDRRRRQSRGRRRGRGG